jgi:hypothetical protein
MATVASFLIPPSLHAQALLLGADGVTIRVTSEASDVCYPICGASRTARAISWFRATCALVVRRPRPALKCRAHSAKPFQS